MHDVTIKNLKFNMDLQNIENIQLDKMYSWWWLMKYDFLNYAK